MKERPILFNGDMVRAILDGRKTQTRRVIKPRPRFGKDMGLDPDSRFTGATPEFRNNYGFVSLRNGNEFGPMRSPCGAPGDRLYVRETWATRFYQDCVKPSDLIPGETKIYHAASPELGFTNVERWRPSVHMPKWAARIWLEVVSVRIERVQDISEEDARSEGVFGDETCREWTKPENFADQGTPCMCFASLWDHINEKRGFGWDANPWVCVVEFKRLSEGVKSA